MADEWYYASGGEQVGPVTWDELKALADDKKLAAGDVVWNESMADWAEADTVEGLVPQTPTARRPPPLPKKAAPPDPAQATRVTGELRLVGTGGKTVMGVEFKVEVLLDGQRIGEGNLTDGLHLRFETTVGSRTFTVTDKRIDSLAEQGGFGALLAGAARLGGGRKALQHSESFPVGFTAPGHYEVVLKARKSLGTPALPKEIEVAKK